MSNKLDDIHSLSHTKWNCKYRIFYTKEVFLNTICCVSVIHTI